jgi:NADH:ubiquinone oxidoreductase subunit 6 (subunit J)
LLNFNWVFNWATWGNILAINIVILAIGVSAFRNPVYSLLALIGVFIHVIIFLLRLRVDFLSFNFLIIYVGAIAILFLFVVMMFNLKDLMRVKPGQSAWSLNWAMFGLFFGIPLLKFLSIIHLQFQHFWMNLTNLFRMDLIFDLYNPTSFFISGYNDIFIFTETLYSHYSLIFLLSSLILLSSMMGAIVLAMSTTAVKPKQKPVTMLLTHKPELVRNNPNNF